MCKFYYGVVAHCAESTLFSSNCLQSKGNECKNNAHGVQVKERRQLRKVDGQQRRIRPSHLRYVLAVDLVVDAMRYQMGDVLVDVFLPRPVLGHFDGNEVRPHRDKGIVNLRKPHCCYHTRGDNACQEVDFMNLDWTIHIFLGKIELH